MALGPGFDNEKYLAEQTASITDRAASIGGKLYLEFGGKLVYDYHASRILPGFDPNVKMRLLQRLKDSIDIVLCIYSGDIERKKIRADFGITYDVDVLRLIDDLRAWGLEVSAVVITRFQGGAAVKQFMNRLERSGISVYTHGPTEGYPADVDLIVSEKGYGANPPIKTRKPIVVVTAPGPGSGKMATCLSQLYHDHKNGIEAGYAKFETFPIWNVPLKHPVNMAYEAATADLGDFNEIDPFHLEAYGREAVNYNRDIEVFPVLRRILERVSGSATAYRSPTDMGVNRAGFAIVDDEAVRYAATQEIIRRYFRYNCEYVMGATEHGPVEKVRRLMQELEVGEEDRPVVAPARAAAESARTKNKGNAGAYCGAALQLPGGRTVSGENSELLHATAALILNTVKALAGIPETIDLLAPTVIESVGRMKKDVLNSRQVSLNVEETLIALSISAASNPTAEAAMEKLGSLKGCEVHLTHMPTPGDEAGLRRLGVNLTSDPTFSSKNLFVT
ncbi:MAG: DUF1846 domain-containing protein [Kiritimatiellia bacterium]